MRRSKYTREVLEEAVAASVSIAGVLRYLGLTWSGGTHAHISRRIRFYCLDPSHFTGQAHNKGVVPRTKLPWQSILVVRDGRRRKEDAHRLRRAMTESGIVYECSGCGCDGTWLGAPLRLEIDHINGDPFDNRRETSGSCAPTAMPRQRPTASATDGTASRSRRRAAGPAGEPTPFRTAGRTGR